MSDHRRKAALQESHFEAIVRFFTTNDGGIKHGWPSSFTAMLLYGQPLVNMSCFIASDVEEPIQPGETRKCHVRVINPDMAVEQLRIGDTIGLFMNAGGRPPHRHAEGQIIEIVYPGKLSTE